MDSHISASVENTWDREFQSTRDARGATGNEVREDAGTHDSMHSDLESLRRQVLRQRAKMEELRTMKNDPHVQRVLAAKVKASVHEVTFEAIAKEMDIEKPCEHALA